MALLATPQVSQAQIVPQSIQVPALEAPRLIEPLVIPEPPELTPRELIINYAIQYGVDVRLALAIATAESGLDPNAKNPVGTASGLAQYLDSTFERYCIGEYQLTDTMSKKNDPKIQAKCLVLMLRDGGIEHWSESRIIWSKLLGRSDTQTGGPNK